MVDWEVTATTIFCDSVNDEVTIIVSGDGAVKCTGWQKYDKPVKEAGKQRKCAGENCDAVKQYRDKLMGEK